MHVPLITTAAVGLARNLSFGMANQLQFVYVLSIGIHMNHLYNYFTSILSGKSSSSLTAVLVFFLFTGNHQKQ